MSGGVESPHTELSAVARRIDDKALLRDVINASPAARSRLRDVMTTLHDYDHSRRSDLVATLRAYVAARFNISRSGEALQIHPNTVPYRLRRIRELTGRDPRNPDDLLALWLALKLDG